MGRVFAVAVTLVVGLALVALSVSSTDQTHASPRADGREEGEQQDEEEEEEEEVGGDGFRLATALPHYWDMLDNDDVLDETGELSAIEKAKVKFRMATALPEHRIIIPEDPAVLEEEEEVQVNFRMATALPEYMDVLVEDAEIEEVSGGGNVVVEAKVSVKLATASPDVNNEVNVTADPEFVSPALKKHHSIWMKRIMESDYVKYNMTEEKAGGKQGRKEDVGGKEGRSDSTNRTLPNRSSRALKKVVDRQEQVRPWRVTQNCECGHPNNHRLRIVGGLETHQHHYPWMASIQVMKTLNHFCGASIISNTFLLTAAHCTDGFFPFELLVRIGDHDLTASDVSREQSYVVDEIIQHPDYNSETTDSDISLLKVAEPISFTWRVSPICLSPQDLTYYRELATVMGWGREREKAKTGSPRLRHVKLKVLPMHECRYNFKLESDEITSKMLCAEGGTKDTCQGDSGGPLTWHDENRDRYFLIGLTSWGVGCGLPKYPGVYTKVTKFLAWIFEETKRSTYCSSYNPTPDKKKKVKKNRKRINIKNFRRRQGKQAAINKRKRKKGRTVGGGNTGNNGGDTKRENGKRQRAGVFKTGRRKAKSKSDSAVEKGNKRVPKQMNDGDNEGESKKKNGQKKRKKKKKKKKKKTGLYKKESGKKKKKKRTGLERKEKLRSNNKKKNLKKKRQEGKRKKKEEESKGENEI